jgi:LAO/AO transport system kinase
MLGIRRGNAFAHVPAHHGPLDRKTAGPKNRPTVQRSNEWEAPVLTTVASKGEGIAELVAALDRHHEHLSTTGKLEERRKRRLAARTRAVVNRAIRQWILDETQADELMAERLDDVAAGRRSPYDVATEVLNKVRNGK